MDGGSNSDDKTRESDIDEKPEPDNHRQKVQQIRKKWFKITMEADLQDNSILEALKGIYSNSGDYSKMIIKYNLLKSESFCGGRKTLMIRYAIPLLSYTCRHKSAKLVKLMIEDLK